jgi:nucleoside-diphosphate-sugar epimerase
MGITALFGAAGAIGKSVAGALRAKGQPYRVVGRNRAKLEAEFGSDPLAQIVTWAPSDAASVRAAANGVDTLIYLVGVPYNHFELHPVVIEQTLAGAIAEGVTRFVLIGTVYPYGSPTTPKVAEGHSREPTTFKGKMRKAQEEILLKAHEEGKIQATILRLPDFYGPGVESSLLNGVFQAAAKGSSADMLGPIDVPHEFVYVPDVGPVVLALAEKPEAYDRWWNLAGAGVTTQREMATMAFALAGLKPKIRVAGNTMVRLIGLFNPIMREFVEMHYLLTNPVLLDDSALYKLLGTVVKTPYADGVRASVEACKART